MIQVKEVVGTPGKQGWVQFHRFSGLEAEKQAERGEMVLLLALEGVSEQAATAFGKDIILRVYEEYYQNLAGTPMARLEKMLEKLGKQRPIYLTEEVKVSLLVAVFWQEFVYLGIWGEGECWLVRQGKITPLLKGRGDKSLVICGQPKKDDLFLLGTAAFFEQIPTGTIQASLQTGKIETAIETLSPLVHAREDQGKIGVVLVKKGEETLTATSSLPTTPLPVKSPRRLSRLPRLRFSWPFAFSRLNLVLGILLLALLVGLVGWGWQRKRQAAFQQKIQNLIAQAEEKLTAAESIRQLDLQQSLALTRQAEDLAKEVLSLSPHHSGAQQLKEQAEKLLLVLGGGEKIQPELFFDLGILAEGAEGKQLVCGSKKLYVLDPASKYLFVFTYPDKSSHPLAGGEVLQEKKFLAVKGKNFYLLDKKGIVFWNGKEKQKRVLEFQWQQPISLGSWGSNLYVLDPAAGKLWKLVGLAKGFAPPRDWFAVPPSFAWETVVDMAINGHIWFLTRQGKVFRFLAGQEDRVNLDTRGIKEGQLLAVASEADRVAVLDTSNKLFVWDKQGELLFQFNLEIEPVLDLVFAPRGRWLFLLTKGKVYWLDLASFDETLRQS